jgi:hypothetical protein
LPLSINLFGVVDLSRSPNKLDCYAYQEFTDKRGSNNVASLLMHNLHRLGMLQRYSPAKRLTIIMDNCGGQNKNNHVICIAAYLVQMKYFRNVEFEFYVRGNTKNACDRLFNQMKICFKKDQVHSYRMALNILNIQPNVSIIDANQYMFKYYGKMLDSFYSNFEHGTIRINHIFKVYMIDDTALDMQCSTHDGSSVVGQSMINWGATLGQERHDLLKSYPLETLKHPGIRAIKQIELYKKWWQFVDPQYWEEMVCPKPADELMEQVKNDKSVKRMETTKQAKASVSEKQQEQLRKKAEKAEERQTNMRQKGRRDRRSC